MRLTILLSNVVSVIATLKCSVGVSNRDSVHIAEERHSLLVCPRLARVPLNGD